MTTIRKAPFAVRFVQRSDGLAGIVYGRRATEDGKDRLKRIASMNPLAVSAASSFLRHAAQESGHRKGAGTDAIATGQLRPLDAEWGPRVACYAMVTSGLRDPERLMRAASQLRAANPDEAAWWLGLLSRDTGNRALRALRILTEAVE
jgi:hypothetical protein